MMGDGRHFLLEGVIGDDVVLAAIHFSDFLRRIVDLVDMSPIMDPSIRCIDRETWSGLVILAESHAAFHIERRWLFLDVFSCKPFDATPIIGYAREVFRIPLSSGKLSHRTIRRGWEVDDIKETRQR